MSASALLLVLLAAWSHATWNLALKKSRGGGVAFFWLTAAFEVVFYAPAAILVFAASTWQPDWISVGMMLGSALIHVAYFVFLDRGYRTGDLSVVYPLARASGPLITIVAAVLLLGERPAPIAVAGALAIGAGAILLSGDPRNMMKRGGVGFALATGAMIALYTVWDRQAVAYFLIPPIIFYWGSIVMRLIATTPHVLGRMAEVRGIWRVDRRAMLIVALLSPLSYGLVLYAMQIAPLSYVAPAREVSILIAALYGTHLLREGDARRRVAAALLMMLGLAGIALG
ncbi:MAG: EamA family transporter [Burkholderiales bacterium]